MDKSINLQIQYLFPSTAIQVLAPLRVLWQVSPSCANPEKKNPFHSHLCSMVWLFFKSSSLSTTARAVQLSSPLQSPVLSYADIPWRVSGLPLLTSSRVIFSLLVLSTTSMNSRYTAPVQASPNSNYLDALQVVHDLLPLEPPFGDFLFTFGLPHLCSYSQPYNIPSSNPNPLFLGFLCFGDIPPAAMYRIRRSVSKQVGRRQQIQGCFFV